MFNNDLLNLLGQVSKFTNVLVLTYPDTYAITPQNDAMIKIPVSSVDADSFGEIGFNNSLSDFLSFTKLLPDDRNLTFDNGIIHAEAGDVSATYITDSLSLLKEYSDADGKKKLQFEKTFECDTLVEFELTADDLTRIKNASGVFKTLPNVVFEAKDDKTSIYLANLGVITADNNSSEKSNTYCINKPIKAVKDFSISLSTTRFNALPTSDYTVYVKYKVKEGTGKEMFRIYMKSKAVEGLDIILFVSVS